MKKTIIIFLILFLLSGCYDYTEIEDTLIITGIIIDYNEDKYDLIIETINNNEKTEIKTYELKCQSIDECIYKLSNVSNKEIFISHLKTLILTKRTINNDLNYIDYFLRNTKSKMNFYVFYVDDKYKDKLFNLNKENSSTFLNELIEFNNKVFSSSTPLSFLDLNYKIKEWGLEPLYPNIIIKDNNIYLENLITFKDGKELVLNEKQSVFYNMITNNINKTLLNIPCDNKYFSLTINSAKTNYKLDENIIYLTTNVKGKIINYNCKYNLDEKDTIKKLSDLTQKYINENVNDLINISKSNNIDFLGLQNYIYKHNYKNYKKYNLNNIDINNKSKVIITSIGEMNK